MIKDLLSRHHTLPVELYGKHPNHKKISVKIVFLHLLGVKPWKHSLRCRNSEKHPSEAVQQFRRFSRINGKASRKPVERFYRKSGEIVHLGKPIISRVLFELSEKSGRKIILLQEGLQGKVQSQPERKPLHGKTSNLYTGKSKGRQIQPLPKGGWGESSLREDVFEIHS